MQIMGIGLIYNSNTMKKPNMKQHYKMTRGLPIHKKNKVK